MTILAVPAFIFIAAGLGMVFSAHWAVEKYALDRKAHCEYENEMEEKDIKEYKFNKALVNFKMLGMLVALPGWILLLVLFKT